MVVIGITGRRFPTHVTHPNDGTALGGFSVDTFFPVYAEHLSRAGASAVFLPREANVATLVERLDGIVLGGGQDIHPERFGGQAGPSATDYDEGQDTFDICLAQEALRTGTPILGTCRGHEVLNVALGGSLVDVDDEMHSIRSVPASARTQSVKIAAGSVLAGILGASVEVNTLHHQAIDRLGAGVIVTARAADGVVEAIEVKDVPAIGVQWHPEFLAPLDPVLGWLVEQARIASGHREKGNS